MTGIPAGDCIHREMGWCPHAPEFRTEGTGFPSPGVVAHPLEPNGGRGGSGKTGRGIRLVAGSAKTLVREKRLLWFPVLTGLVILFLFAAAFLIHVYGTYPYGVISFPTLVALIFACEMITVFCINFLLASLILSISADGSGRTTTLREAFSRAASHLRPLLGLSLGMALAGTILYVALSHYSDILYLAVSGILTRFPFYFVIMPEVNGPGPIVGGFHVLYAAIATTIVMAINVVLFILTLYIVPSLVLEKKRLAQAARDSVSLMKKTWGELVVCIIMFGLILLGISLTSLIFLAAYDVVSFDINTLFYLFFWYQGGWIACAAVYMAVWLILVLIGSTIAGIAVGSLYTYGKTGRIPEIPLQCDHSGDFR
ncbi:MAG: DUF6159 family protein [Methanoregulaceae archaeon]